MTTYRRWLQALVACLGLLGLGWGTPAVAQVGSTFDHFTTGFELIGKHNDVPCEGCHVAAVFKGTPRACASCHQRGSRVSATPKHTAHVLSTDRCESCHTPQSFKPAVKFDHREMLGSCSSCWML